MRIFGSNLVRSKTERGFSLTELTIALALSSLLAIGGYRFTSQSLKQTTKETSKRNLDREILRALGQFGTQINNALVIPGGEATVLANLSTSAISPTLCPEMADPPHRIPSGLIPFPGRTLNTLSNDFDPIDPSDFQSGGEDKSDGIRFVHLRPESHPISLAQNPLDNLPHPTAGDPAPPIRLESSGDLFAGDYALICDWQACDFFRITGTASGGKEIEHSSASIWNLPFTRNFGRALGGPAFVQKVGFVDYQHDPATAVLYADTHAKDDGFDPSTNLFGSAGRIPSWTPAATKIEKFRIFYEVDRPKEGTKQVRTPRAWSSDKNSSCVGNELGYPRFLSLTIDVEIKDPDGSKVIRRNFTPDNLTRAPHFAGSGENLDREPIEIAGVSTPIPPGGSGTSGGTPPPSPGSGGN